MIKTLAVIGIIGGFLCAVADLFLDLKGTGNEKIGNMGVIDSKWVEMPHFRFVVSDLIAMFAVPMYTCGFVALMNILAETHETLAKVFTIVFLCGAMGGFMIHTILCLMPTIYTKIIKKNDSELAKDVVESVFRQIYVPFFSLYACLVIVPAVFVIVLIILGILPLPIWCVILNPVVIQVIGLLFRATKLDIFIDAPSCCAASIGLAMYGVLALMLL